MKNILLLLAVFAVTLTSLNAQNAHCGFDEHLEKMLAQDPSGIQVIRDRQALAASIKHQRLTGEAERAGGPRIVPTVFHVIHQGGNENISKEQIEDQMRILNEDFRRLNADASNLRPEFVDVAADANVEFRLAKLDPQGNCTDGIVRVWSPLTFNASDNNGVKGLSYWNSSKYFNVWVVATIDNEGEPGTILGYAQFPGFGGASTDGVVVRANYVGDIGTGANNGSKGRTLTHEAGHWLGLLHTFQGGCNGGFFGESIDDTPPQAEATPSNCPQNSNTCSNDNPNLPDMVENYMDYSNGACQNTFTEGQKDAFDAVLGATRSQLISNSNLNATGVLLAETPCAPVAQFYLEKTIVCAGTPVQFTDDTYNGTPSTYDWQFPGATPSQSGDANPTVTYNAPGVYSVTLNVSNAQGSDSYTQTNYVEVISGTAINNNWIAFEGFEAANDNYVIVSDGNGNTWEETTASYTDAKAIYLNNRIGNPAGSVDEFILEPINLSIMNEPDLYFRLAYKERSGASDNLRVYVSDNCGDSWSLRYNKSGGSLATVSGTQSSAFTPTSAADWELIEVNLNAFANDDHVLVKFRGTSDAGNNIYIDDIQISGPLGVESQNVDFSFEVSPNPMEDEAIINLNVATAANYRVSVLDVAGKQVATLLTGALHAGKHKFNLDRNQVLTAGVYLVSVESESGRSVKKLIVR